MRLISLAIAGILLTNTMAPADLSWRLARVNNCAAAADPACLADLRTYDLVMVITPNGCTGGGDDDWIVAEIRVEGAGIEWFDHPLGTDDEKPPDPALFPLHPALEFDSFYCAADPDVSDGAPAPYFAIPASTSPTAKSATWFDLDDTGSGAFVIARYSFAPVEDDWWLWIDGASASLCAGVVEPDWPIGGPVTCDGDLQGDRDVDLSDLAILLASYGLDDGGDIDCDGATDLRDLAILLAHYGEDCGSS